MKKIVYITGTRADFGRVHYILKEIQNHKDFDLEIIATCMHLSPLFGNTIKEVEKEFKVREKVNILFQDNTNDSMVKSLGIGILRLTESIKRINPDIILVFGDRGEMLAAALIGAHLNIPVVHIAGGHISGSIDDKIRNAITVFSDIHLVANEIHAERVKRLGANPSKVYVVGAPDLDSIRRKDFSKKEQVVKKFNLNPNEPLILALLHPVTDQYDKAESQMRELCEIIAELKIQTIFIYPNADAGGQKMIKVLENYSKYPFIKIYKNIPYKLFLGIMNIASVIVGNSSAGIIESASFGLPSVNIGGRQKGRERAENIIDVEWNKEEIINAVKTAIYNKKFINKAKNAKNPYGKGNTSKQIIKILENIYLNKRS